MAAIEPRAVRDYLIGLQARITSAVERLDGVGNARLQANQVVADGARFDGRHVSGWP